MCRLFLFMVALLTVLPSVGAQELNRTYEELPLGTVKPDGWLREMLQRQRDGVTADLDKIYPQVVGERNGWLGGDGDQWERGPYWIDGLLPIYLMILPLRPRHNAGWNGRLHPSRKAVSSDL